MHYRSNPTRSLLLLSLIGFSLTSCAMQKPAAQNAIKVTLKQDAATALADIVANKSVSDILTDEAVSTLFSISNQAKAQGGELAVVEITAAGQAVLKDYLAKASAAQEVSDAALAGLRALTDANSPAAP